MAYEYTNNAGKISRIFFLGLVAENLFEHTLCRKGSKNVCGWKNALNLQLNFEFYKTKNILAVKWCIGCSACWYVV